MLWEMSATIQNMELSTNSKVHDNHFVVNMKLFTESQNHNTFFNQKMTIDETGNVKNAPNSKVKYGKILDIDIEEVVKTDAFQRLWNINKDIIKTCKDCEFRYMCTDGSDLTHNDSEDIWIADEKCNYNPINTDWEN